MAWFKQAIQNSEKAIAMKIKGILKSHPFFLKLMQDYHIPMDDLDNHLRLVFADLQGKYAEGNGEEIKLDRHLLDGDFFDQNFHFVVHEFYHWVKRRSEALFYFNDDEEKQSFTLAVAWELLAGKPEQQIVQAIYPIVAGHFKDKEKAHQLFGEILAEAKRIILVFKKSV